LNIGRSVAQLVVRCSIGRYEEYERQIAEDRGRYAEYEKQIAEDRGKIY
jgi:hypothetical protein